MPRKSCKTYDEQGLFQRQDLDLALRNRLALAFELPPATSVNDPKPSDLVLDVVVSEYQSGYVDGVDLGDVVVPLFWRPKEQLRSRLYYRVSGETKAVAIVSKKLSLQKFLRGTLKARAFFGIAPTFETAEIEALFEAACLDLMDRIRDST